MVGVKAKTIKFLHSKGIRYLEKQGVGLVSLEHIKTTDLINYVSAKFDDYQIVL